MSDDQLADRFGPYVNYPPGLPLDQWEELNQSPRWSAFFLFRDGKPVSGNAERCPTTMAALDIAPQPSVVRRSPAAMFSVLQPRTRIPPAHRRQQHAPRGSPAAGPAARLPLPGRQRDPPLARGGSLGVRRHHRTRSVERRRSTPYNSDLRHLEPIPYRRRSANWSPASPPRPTPSMAPIRSRDSRCRSNGANQKQRPRWRRSAGGC